MYDLAERYCFRSHLDHDDTIDRELSLLLLFLEQYVNGAIIEMSRLERTRRSLDEEWRARRLARELRKRRRLAGEQDLGQNMGALSRKRDSQLTYLECDTHFFFICINQCYKLIPLLSQKLNDNEITKLATELNGVFDIRTIRDHLEHVEDRCQSYLSREDRDRKIKKPISDFGNFVGGNFSFNGKEFRSDRKSLEKLEEIYLRLIGILDDRARKDPEFVREMEMKETSELAMKAWKKWSRLQNRENSPPRTEPKP
jgi:hypothetical protein